MYTLVQAIARPIGGNGRWSVIPLGDMLLPDVFSQYARVIATLSNNFLTKPVALELALIRPTYGSQSITFNQYLAQVGNTTIQGTSETLPVINTRYTKYADAFHAGYSVQAIHPTADIDAQVPAADRTWLYMTRPDTDYMLFYRSCLVSVNGLIHATDATTDGIYVKEGMKSQMISNKAKIGMMSFRELGALSYIPITADMVYKQAEGQVYKDRAHVDLGQDVSDKTVMLVLGGYLHILDPRTFYRISDSSFAVVFANLPLIDRYYDSVTTIDLSSMNVEKSVSDDNHILVESLFSDEAILAYLTLSQSFFVVLDNTEVFVDRKLIEKTPLPNLYISYEQPIYPLFSELGKMVNYWYTYEDGQFSISTTDAMRHNYNYRTVDQRNAFAVNANRIPGYLVANGDLQYVRLGADI